MTTTEMTTTEMTTTSTTDPARAFWRDVLLAGGGTAVPRWSAGPQPGAGVHRQAVPEDLVAALSTRAGALAAHAKVLASVSGEPEVVTGVVVDGRRLPCRLVVGEGSWLALLADVDRAASELAAHADFPLEELRRELGVPGPSVEVVLDPGGDGDLTAGTVLRVGVADGGRVLVLRFRTDVLDAAAAARIAGYHLTALTQMTADPAADHGRQSLLSREELRFQLEELAGPARQLPDRRFHELFEDRVRAHPHAVAAVHGEREWTYRELDSRANRLARALRARGLDREGVVAVVTERNLDWMAAVLAVFKAGGVYLPVEPHFPAARIATVLARAGCRWAVTEPGSSASLDAALAELPGVQRLEVQDADAEGHPDGSLGIPVGPDQLAYVYFTSGSTGEPKGAMCEHAGMLNHLLAKVEDLDIAEGSVVAQTAPQCFDISLWQLLAALLVGGRTVVVEQAVVLDVARYVDTLAAQRVAVVQMVPSYLEVVLTHRERHPRPLPDLRCVSATGEALKADLIRRWFALEPDVPLVNAYGLTETSDDTNHEVLRRPPADDRVPLGRPIRNVVLYVVDEQLRPVPLGAPGLIAFSGVCVGRGYVNDPVRTREAYRVDPHREGARLYLGGDYGRWRPDGKLEFLGRRDAQVKISGFRIEIGEVENALLRVPGVRDGAVVVAERGDGSRRLVAFYSAAAPLPLDVLRDGLGASLPGYMVPAAFHHRGALPLTPNSKIDKKVLGTLAAELGTGEPGPGDDGYHAPSGPGERRLAAAFATVLGIGEERVGRHDHFFDRGGTSLSAVKLVIALRRAVSITDVTAHPVLADLAALLDGRGEPAPAPTR
ncbi:non-ribosomal peptide synthetase [Pseudonocardia sichuanensis]